MKVRELILFAIYLAIGLACWMLIYAGPIVDWANPWMYIVMVMWPIVLVVVAIKWILIICVVIGSIAIVYSLIKHYVNKLDNRKIKPKQNIYYNKND